MGTKVEMSAAGVSKLITISPRFLAYNKTKVRKKNNKHRGQGEGC